MGEARRRAKNGSQPNKPNPNKSKSPNIIPGVPITIEQREKFFSITKLGAWIGIGALLILWIVVRFVGPSLGWWVPADAR